MARVPSSKFWTGKRVLITGHSGFKGGWLVHWLSVLGADLTGISLPPDSDPSLFDLTDVAANCDSRFADLRDAANLGKAVAGQTYDIVIHMAAQALVRGSIADPVDTFATNVQGTVNLLEALRRNLPAATLVITTDKVYRNDGLGRPFGEDDPLGGHDPYSASKAACEIAVQSYRSTYFQAAGARLATARGGNVIGGGDFAEDRIVPDCVRASLSGNELTLRHPEATRPWQHVLDCLNGYILYAEDLHGRADCPTALNIGPDMDRPVSVGDVATAMQSALGVTQGWVHQPVAGSVEAQLLALDPSRAKQALAWENLLDSQQAINMTAHWYRDWQSGGSMRETTVQQLQEFTRMAETAGHE